MSKKVIYIFSVIFFIIFAIWIWTFATMNKKPIILGGSTSVNSFMQKVTTDIKDIDYEYNSTGSQNGINGVNSNIYTAGFLSKTPDSGNWDKYSKSYDEKDINFIQEYVAEKQKNYDKMTALDFGTDAIIMIGNTPSDASDKNLELTYEEIKGIYEGSIINWDQLGDGKYGSGKIIPYTRESGSGTRSSFEEKMNISIETKSSVANSNGMMYSSIESTECSIGFVSLSFAQQIDSDSSIYLIATSKDGQTFDRVGYSKDGEDEKNNFHEFNKDGQKINFDKQITNEEAIQNQDYDLTRPFVMVYKNKNVKFIKELLDFFVDLNNRSIYEDEGLVFTFKDLNP